MKKKISIILIVAMTMAITLTGCGNKVDNDSESGKSKRKQEVVNPKEKEKITVEEGLELVKEQEKDASILQELKIGGKIYYSYSPGRQGDSVICVDPETKEILHYNSDGTLVNSKGEVISTEKAEE
ncbi:MAG: hypothetical protein ACLSV2_11080 [Clostridium sp.]